MADDAEVSLDALAREYLDGAHGCCAGRSAETVHGGHNLLALEDSVVLLTVAMRRDI